MSGVGLALTPEEQATLEKIAVRFPGLVAAVEQQVAVRIEDAVRRLQGWVPTEGGVDYVLGRLIDGGDRSAPADLPHCR